MGPADATDAGAVAPDHDYLLCRSSRLAVNPPTPTRRGIHKEKFVRMPRQKRHSDAAQKDLHKCDKAASR